MTRRAPLARKLKSNASLLDYVIDWSAWLNVGDLLSDSVYVISPVEAGGIVQVDASHTTTVTTVWLSGGVVGRVYTIVNRVATVAGIIDERYFEITII